VISGCRILNCTGNGIRLTGCYNPLILDTEIENCAFNGVNLLNCTRSRISRLKIMRTIESGIRISCSPNSFIEDCNLGSCGLVTAGIYVLDCDNTIVQGNTVQRSAFGLYMLSSSGRSNQSFGASVVGNDFTRNYVSGVKFLLGNGFQFSGNVVANNNQGGTDNNTYTVEPGITVDPAFGGTGYQVGDVLTLVGGAGTLAQVMVKKVFAGGSLYGGALSNDAVFPISLGSYTTFPPASTTATGGHGSGAQFIYSGASINNGGSGYVQGQTLVANNGAFTNPCRVMVTKVGGGGVVGGIEILDGGGYNGAGLPVALLFSPDNLADGQNVGSGLQLLPAFGKRYSANFNAYIPFGVCTYGPITGGVINSNVIDTTRSGIGILVQDDVAPYNGRASYLIVDGNSLMNNANSIAGDTVGNPIDQNYNINSIFANNIISPPSS
jgi:parallel beta-helix repeat protein